MNAIPDFLTPVSCPSLLSAYRCSVQQVAKLQRRFEMNAAHLDCIETIALGGSLGRLEVSVDSDVDCIIVLRDDAPAQDCDAQVAHDEQRPSVAQELERDFHRVLQRLAHFGRHGRIRLRVSHHELVREDPRLPDIRPVP